ncbi:MAG: 23S rRNA (guanosine(2251)-2'-O)-methyltransferase RlmB [Planctomyces sp.]|nr:23S rRNA (guanosine(2251)-2'-O)-methyltransferase RlmB [Planctomyces sp.]
MVGRRRGAKRGRPLAGGPQRCWIWGRNAVLETLRAGRWTPLEVVVADRCEADIAAESADLAARQGVPVRRAEFEELTDRCRSTEHQGLLAKMPEFPYASLDECLRDRGEPRFLVLLDGVQDPHNFGAVLRSAEALGAGGVIVPGRGQSAVTPHVARSSAGAVNHLPICQASDLAETCARLRELGIVVCGAAGDAGEEARALPGAGPIALVLGNEGAGLSLPLRAACDRLVRIPQTGRTESLNVAVAAGILCYEVRRQRTPAIDSARSPR